jgi:hypothetical protein
VSLRMCENSLTKLVSHITNQNTRTETFFSKTCARTWLHTGDSARTFWKLEIFPMVTGRSGASIHRGVDFCAHVSLVFLFSFSFPFSLWFYLNLFSTYHSSIFFFFPFFSETHKRRD